MRKFKDVIVKLMYILNRQQKMLSILVLVVTCLGSILECLGVSMIIPVVNAILMPEALINSELFQSNIFLKKMDYSSLVILVTGATIIVYLLKNTFFICLSWVRIKFSCKIQREISIRMMESYMSRGYQFFLERSYGELSRGIDGDPATINTTIYAGFKIISDSVTIVLLCGFMFITDWSFSLAMMAVSVICILLIYFVFKRKMAVAGEQNRAYRAKTSQALLQALQGIKDVLMLRKQRHFIREYEINKAHVQNTQCRQIVGTESPAYIIEGLCVSCLMLVVAIKVVSGVGQTTEFIADLAAFAIAAFRMLPCIGRISASLNQVITSLPCIDAIYDNIKETEKFAQIHPELNIQKNSVSVLISRIDSRDYKKVARDEEIQKIFKKSVELKNITFRYNKEQDNIIENLNLKIDKGQAIALIGASGAGKSTLVDILLGLLIPQQGGVYLDGVPITKEPELWTKTVAYVPQSVFMSSGSVLENVAFGECKDEIDLERAWEALERAELAGFIKQLPSGIDTLVGDRGVRLSGGQRQRIAIARALYHRPEILVLDEATSALDNDTETSIMSAIDSLQGQVTLIIVAHRLTTVKNCDVIYEVCDKGIIVREKSEIFGK